MLSRTIRLLSRSLRDRERSLLLASSQNLIELRRLHEESSNTSQHRSNPVSSSKALTSTQIETLFHREVDSFKALLMQSSAAEIGRIQSQRIVASMDYFGLSDDSAVHQLTRLLSTQAMRSDDRRTRNAQFKGNVPPRQSLQDQVRKVSQRQIAPSDLPSEFPMTPPVDQLSAYSQRKVVRVRDAHRGHWILRDPDIAMSKRERRVDAW